MSPAVKAVLDALAGATVAGVTEALSSNDEEAAIAAAKASLHEVERRIADERGRAKFPDFRGS